MPTIEEILTQVGLGDSQSQTKTAAATSAPKSQEVNQVLESLGLSGVDESAAAGVTKTASEGRNNMGFSDFYDDLFADVTPDAAAAAAAAEQEKTAAAAAAAAGGEGASAAEVAVEDPTDNFGQLTGVYVNVLADSYFEKLAGDLEMEAGKGFKPQAGVNDGGELSRIVGKEGDPSIEMNHDASSGAGLKVNPGNQTPYSLKARAQIKAILKRNMKSEPGDLGGYNE
jgi:hypothetical protein